LCQLIEEAADYSCRLAQLISPTPDRKSESYANCNWWR